MLVSTSHLTFYYTFYIFYSGSCERTVRKYSICHQRPTDPGIPDRDRSCFFISTFDLDSVTCHDNFGDGNMLSSWKALIGKERSFENSPQSQTSTVISRTKLKHTNIINFHEHFTMSRRNCAPHRKSDMIFVVRNFV